MSESEWDWLFNVTCIGISVIYVTAHRCAGGLKKKMNLRSGSQRQRQFVGFVNVPVIAPTRPPFLYGYSEKPPHLVTFYDTLVIRRTFSRLNPSGPHGGVTKQMQFQRNMSYPLNQYVNSNPSIRPYHKTSTEISFRPKGPKEPHWRISKIWQKGLINVKYICLSVLLSTI